MKQIPLLDLLSKLDPSTYGKLFTSAERYQSTHVVLFEDQALEHMTPRVSALLVGPNNTYKSPGECEGKHLNDLPSQRLYPTVYAELEDDEDQLEGREPPVYPRYD